MTQRVHTHDAAPTLAILTSTWPRNPHDISGRFLLDLVSALSLPCEIVCPDHGEHGAQALRSARLQRFANDGVFYGAGALGNIADNGLNPLAAVRSVGSMMRAALSASRRCDIVFSHWAVPGGLVGALCRRITGRPHVLLLHSADVFWLEQRRCGQALAEFIADHCDALCGVSEAVVSRFEALSGRRGRVLGCGVTVPAAQTSPRPMAAPSNSACPTAKVGTLSRFVAGKGLRRLLQATTMLPGTLHIAGAGPLGDEIAALCAAHDTAQLDGPCVGERKVRWLQQLDVFAAPSTGMPWGQPEGLPVSILEAQAAGLPVVAFADALPKGLVRDRQNGRLVASGDWAGFASTLAELLRDDAQRQALGERARADAKPYAMNAVAEQWRELFAAVHSRGRRNAPGPHPSPVC